MIWDAEDKIFTLCMVKINEFPQYLTNLNDICAKFDTKFVSGRFKTLNLDSVRMRGNENLVNIEHHSSINNRILSRNYEYMVGLHAEFNRIIEPFIFNTGKIMRNTIDYANPTMFYNPIWINTQEMEGIVKFNNIKYKLLNNEPLNVFDILDLIWMPKFRFDCNIKEVILEIVEIYPHIIVNEELLHVLWRSIVLWVGKYIEDENDELKKRGFDMSALKLGSLEEDYMAARRAGIVMRALEKGKQEGFDEGKQEGFVEGKRKGFDEGKMEVLSKLGELEVNFVSRLLKFDNPDVISEMFDIPLSKVLEIKDSLK